MRFIVPLLLLLLVGIACAGEADQRQRWVHQGKVMAMEGMLCQQWRVAKDLRKAGDQAGYERARTLMATCINIIAFSDPSSDLSENDELAVRIVSSELRDVANELLAAGELETMAKSTWFPDGFKGFVERMAANGSFLFAAGRDQKQKEIDDMHNLIRGKEVSDELLAKIAGANESLKTTDYLTAGPDALMADIRASKRITSEPPVENLTEIPAAIVSELKGLGFSDVRILRSVKNLSNPVTKTRYLVVPTKDGKARLVGIDR